MKKGHNFSCCFIWLLGSVILEFNQYMVICTFSTRTSIKLSSGRPTNESAVCVSVCLTLLKSGAFNSYVFKIMAASVLIIIYSALLTQVPDTYASSLYFIAYSECLERVLDSRVVHFQSERTIVMCNFLK
jgi:hypothetical protein